MALTFGRGRHADAAGKAPTSGSAASRAAGHDSAVVSEWRAAVEESFTGTLEVGERAHHGHARLYLFEGSLYSVELAGYVADPITRLVTAGAISPADAAGLRSSATPERVAVESGLVTIDAVARVHQEYLLASAGAVLDARLGRPRRHEGEVTGVLCTEPVSVDDVLAAAAMRRERRESTWRLVSTEATPATLVVRRTTSTDPLPSALPELAAVAGAIDGTRSVDDVACSLGLTRAEAVHLVASLVAAGFAESVPGAPVHAPDHLLVPEEFGEVTVAAGLPSPAAASVMDPTTDVMPEAKPEEAPVDQEVIARIEAELAEAMRAERDLAARIAQMQEQLAQARGVHG